jgi:hypothetical protein
MPEGKSEAEGEDGEDYVGLGELRGGDSQRAGQQVELVPADRVEERAAAVGELVADDMRHAADADGYPDQRDMPGMQRDGLQVAAEVDGGGRAGHGDYVAVVAADLERPQRGGIQQGEEYAGRHQVPEQRWVPGR